MSLNFSDFILGKPDRSPGNEDDDLLSDSDEELPFLQPVSKEELRISRAFKRAQAKAEKHTKAEVFKRMGDELYSKGRYEEAVTPYLEATQIWPSSLDYAIRLAVTYAKLGSFEESAHASTRALTLNPKSIEARYVRGVARLEQRLLSAAKSDLEIVVAHDKTHQNALNALTLVKKSIEAKSKLVQNLATAPPPNSAPRPLPELDLSYPLYEDEALEVDSLSNTSDCNHRGNGVPCRFYNRQGGCAKASLCPYSHAPDEKSVRDQLGRNVCIYFLLDLCKFGNAKCVYSHSKFDLPRHGWWTSAKGTAKIKAIVEMSDKMFKERRSHLAHLHLLEMRARAKAIKAAAVKASKAARAERAAAAVVAAEAPGANGAPVSVSTPAAPEGKIKLEDKSKPKENGATTTTTEKVDQPAEPSATEANAEKAQPQAEPTVSENASPPPVPVKNEAQILAAVDKFHVQDESKCDETEADSDVVLDTFRR